MLCVICLKCNLHYAHHKVFLVSMSLVTCQLWDNKLGVVYDGHVICDSVYWYVCPACMNVCLSACMSVCMYVLSYLSQCLMYEAELS